MSLNCEELEQSLVRNNGVCFVCNDVCWAANLQAEAIVVKFCCIKISEATKSFFKLEACHVGTLGWLGVEVEEPVVFYCKAPTSLLAALKP